MAQIIRSIKSFKDFFYIQENYKRIYKLSNQELKFYLFNLEKNITIKEILEVIKETKFWLDFDFNLIEENKSNALFYLKIFEFFGDKKEESELLLFHDKENSNVLLLTDENTRKLKIIENFSNKLFPYANKKFIKSKEIIEIIQSFLEEGYYLTASMVSFKKWWEKAKRSGTGVDYVRDIPIKEVLERLVKDKSFINSIIINIFDSKGENRILRTYLSRKGLLKFKDGYFRLFRDKILNKIILEIDSEKKILSNRSRNEKEIKPLKVIFKRALDLPPKEITKQFAKSISHYRELSLAIIHNGNPYFYASVTNNFDGSVFDILFQNTNCGSELVVIPQYSASMNSLSKFFTLVYSQFGEGQISEYNET